MNRILEEEVYIDQPKGFIDPNKRDMVCKLHKALYGLRQAPREWYERLHGYLVKIGFEKTTYNTNLYSKEGPQDKILNAKIFVDDILFIGHDDLCKTNSEEMRKESKMSMFGQVKFFVGLQVHQMNNDIYIT